MPSVVLTDGPGVAVLDGFISSKSLLTVRSITSLLLFSNGIDVGELPLLGGCHADNCPVLSTVAQISIIGVDCWSCLAKPT